MGAKTAPPRRKRLRLWIALGTAAAIVAGLVSCNAIINADTGTVTQVVDGETLMVSMGDSEKVVRLLNVESAKEGECLAVDAREFLTKSAPVGSKVKLKFDGGYESSESTLVAAVFNDSGVLVNAEMVGQGLAIKADQGTDRAYLDPLDDAEHSAAKGARGLHSAESVCTLPGQLKVATDSLVEVVKEPTATTSGDASNAVASAVAAVATAKTLAKLLKAGKETKNALWWAAYTPVELAKHAETLLTDIAKGEKKVAASTADQKRLADAEAKAAAEKKAAAEAAAQAKAAAEAAAAEAERIRKLPPVYVPPAPPVYQPPAQGTGGGPDRYTGPRCYAPGGKTYRPC